MKSRFLTFGSRWVLVLAVLAYSCSEPDTVPEIPKDPPPTGSLPSCGPSVRDGYCGKVSYQPGDVVDAYLNASNPTICSLSIYTLSMSAEVVVPATVGPQRIQKDNPSEEGFGYEVSVSFTLPDLPSGIYLIEKTIPFIVKPKGNADVIVVYPSNTANAYAQSGGKSLYTPDRATTVSFHRPIGLQDFCKECLAWFDSQTDFSVGYIADSDLDDFNNIAAAKLLVIIGHNEYWTRQARLNFDTFVDSGHDALILSGNTMWWQVRYTTDGAPGVVCYKNKDNDPIQDPLLKTYLWNSSELEYPIIRSIGADFDNGGYGLKADDGWNGYKITSQSSPLLEGLSLKAGDIISCPTAEYDGAPLTFSNGTPVLDLKGMDVEKAELIAYDFGFRVKQTAGTFIVFQRRPTSGIVINTGSTNWCSVDGMGGTSGTAIRRITRNAIVKLLSKESVFSF
jgi:hypothetical protein